MSLHQNSSKLLDLPETVDLLWSALNNIKHLITGPEGSSLFCFPKISNFPRRICDLLHRTMKTKEKQCGNK